MELLHCISTGILREHVFGPSGGRAATEILPPCDTVTLGSAEKKAAPAAGRLPATDAAAPASGGRPKKPPSSSPAVESAAAERARRQEELAVREIHLQMAMDRRKWQQKIMAILADLATELFEMWQAVMLRRQKAMDDALDKWSKVLTGS